MIKRSAARASWPPGSPKTRCTARTTGSASRSKTYISGTSSECGRTMPSASGSARCEFEICWPKPRRLYIRHCGAGAKGPRVSDWARCHINCSGPVMYARWQLIRRSTADSDGRHLLRLRRATGYRAGRVGAGRRRAVGSGGVLRTRQGGDCWHDEYEVRSYVGWH